MMKNVFKGKNKTRNCEILVHGFVGKRYFLRIEFQQCNTH